MTIKLNFYRSKTGERNFGDELSPLLVGLLTNRKIIHSKASQCNMISLGSIFEMTTKRLLRRKILLNFNPIHVWGTGFVYPNKIKINKYYKNYKIHAVRGNLSREKLNLPDTLALGDPGLLSKHLIKPQEKKISTLIIPHVEHRKHKSIQHLEKSIKNCVVADLTQDPIEILKLISSSDRVISSSLHGLICADSLGVQNIRINLKSGLKGGDFKFIDYNSAIKKPNVEIYGIETQDEIFKKLEGINFSYFDNVDNVCHSLQKAFPNELR
jgi:hypothetical protein